MQQRERADLLKFDDDLCILVRFKNRFDPITKKPIHRIGYRGWLGVQYGTEEEWAAALAEMKDKSNEVAMFWPRDVNVNSAKQLVRDIKDKEFDPAIVQVISYGERVAMNATLKCVLKTGLTSPKKEDRKVSAKKKIDANYAVTDKKKMKKGENKQSAKVTKRSEEEKKITLEKLSKAKSAREALSEISQNTPQENDSHTIHDPKSSDGNSAAETLSLIVGSDADDKTSALQPECRNDASGPSRVTNKKDESKVLNHLGKVCHPLSSVSLDQELITESTTQSCLQTLKKVERKVRQLSYTDDSDDDESTLGSVTMPNNSSLMTTEESQQEAKRAEVPQAAARNKDATPSNNDISIPKNKHFEALVAVSPASLETAGKSKAPSTIIDSSAQMDGEPTVPTEDVVADLQRNVPALMSAGSITVDEVDTNAIGETEKKVDFELMGKEELRKELLKTVEQLKSREEELRQKDKKLQEKTSEAHHWKTQHDKLENRVNRLEHQVLKCFRADGESLEPGDGSPQNKASLPRTSSSPATGLEDAPRGQKRKRGEADTPQDTKRRKSYPLPTKIELSSRVKGICDSKGWTVSQVVREALPVLFTKEVLKTSCVMGARSRKPDTLPKKQKPRGPPLDKDIINALLNRCHKNFKKDKKWYSKFMASAKYTMKSYRNSESSGASKRKQPDDKDSNNDDAHSSNNDNDEVAHQGHDDEIESDGDGHLD